MLCLLGPPFFVNDHLAVVGGRRLRISSDNVENFFCRDKRPTLNWLNRIITTVWLNYRALATHMFTNDIWPLIQSRIATKAGLKGIKLHQFTIGNYLL